MHNNKSFQQQLEVYLKVFQKDKQYNKTMCSLMKRIIFHEIREHKYYANKIDHPNSYLYFIRIRKAEGNLYKIGITHNKLTDRIVSIINGDFKDVDYRIIIVGCIAIKGQQLENVMKQKLKHYMASIYERPKRNGTLSTESYRVSARVYNEIKHIFKNQNKNCTFWSTRYGIDCNDKETYYGVDLGENSIFMED